MKFKKVKNKYFLRLEKGEKIIETLLKLLEEKKIKAGYFNGLGAVSHVVLAHYNLDKKKYSEKEFSGQKEIVSFHGNISQNEKESYVHAHMCVGDENMELKGGHCKEATVAATCEIVLVKVDVELDRYADEEIGLNLFKF